MRPPPSLQLFTRSLREDVRGFQSHATRLLLAVVLGVGLLSFVDMLGRSSAPGRYYFNMIVHTNWIALALLGVSIFSAAISEEKEERSIGLLRMTGMTPLAILIGKGLSRVWLGLVLIALQLPFVVLAVTMGGVSTSQVLAAFVALMVFMLTVASIAILASVVRASHRGASGTTLLILVALMLGPWLVQGIGHWARLDPVIELGQAAASLSIVNRLNEIGTSGFTGAVLWNRHTLGGLVLSVVCLLIAWRLFDRYAVDTENGGEIKVWRAGRVSRVVWGDGLLWKDYLYCLGGRLGLGIRVALMFVLVMLFVMASIASRSGPDLSDIGDVLFGIAMVLVPIDIGFCLSRSFGFERVNETWSGLVLTGVSIQRQMFAKVRATLLAVAPGIGLGLIGLVLGDNVKNLFDMQFSAWAFLGGMLVFFWSLCVLYAVVVRRGGLALAFVTMILSWFVFGFMGAVSRGAEGIAVLFGFLYLGASVGALVLAGNKIRTLAAN